LALTSDFDEMCLRMSRSLREGLCDVTGTMEMTIEVNNGDNNGL